MTVNQIPLIFLMFIESHKLKLSPTNPKTLNYKQIQRPTIIVAMKNQMKMPQKAERRSI